LITLLATPLYFNVLTYRIFEPDKVALMRSVALVGAAAWCVKQLATRSMGSIHLSSPPSLTHRFPALFFPVLLLLVLTLFSTATSILPRVSLWGSYERGQGLYTFLAYLFFFFLTFELARQPMTRTRILDAILLASVPVSTYAVLQHYGRDILEWQTGGTATTVRAIGTLGNPIFLGAYLVMVIPVTLARIARSIERLTRGDWTDAGSVAVHSALLALQMLALFFAQSRGPIIGLLGGLAFGGLVWGARLRSRRALLTGIGMLILAIGILGLARIGGLTRLANPFDPTARTAQQRLFAWKGVMDLLHADPARALIGYGPETLREALQPYLPAELARLVPDQDFDRAHNLMLDTWVEVGVLGVIAWLAVIVVLLFQGLHLLGIVDDHNRRTFAGAAVAGIGLGFGVPFATGQGAWVGVSIVLGLFGALAVYLVATLIRRMSYPERPSRTARGRAVHPEEGAPVWITTALITGIVAHLGETLVGIPTTSTRLLFWVYAAMIAAVAQSQTAQDVLTSVDGKSATAQISRVRAPDFAKVGEDRDPRSLWAGIALALLAFPFVTAGVAIQAGPRQGFLLWMVIVTSTLSFDLAFIWLTSLQAQEQPLTRHLGLIVGAVFAFLALTWAPLPPLDLTRSTVAVFLYVVVAVLALGTLYSNVTPDRMLKKWRPNRLQSVGVILIAMITFGLLWFVNVNPIRADLYYKDGITRSRTGNWESVLASFHRSVALMPREDRYHSALGAAYVQRAQQASDRSERIYWLRLAEVSLLEAHRLDPYRADHLRNLGVLHRRWADLGSPEERVGHLRQASEYYRQAVTRNPISVHGWREWGEVYAALEEWDAAIQRYQESLRLNDGFPETWLLLGKAYLRNGNYPGAREAYARAWDLDSSRVLRELQAAAAQFPDHPWPHQALALVYTFMGQTRSAEEEAQTASNLMEEGKADWMKFLENLR